MKQFLKYSKLLLVSVLCLVLLITSFATASQNAVGAYSTNSAASTASTKYPANKGTMALPLPAIGILAAAVGIVTGAYALGYAIGTVAHHAINEFIVEEGNQLAIVDYDATDFSKFD